MIDSSHPILTVNKRAERRARLAEARAPAVRRRLCRSLKRIAFLSLSLALMLLSFPRLLKGSASLPAAETFSPQQAGENREAVLLPVHVTVPDVRPAATQNTVIARTVPQETERTEVPEKLAPVPEAVESKVKTGAPGPETVKSDEKSAVFTPETADRKITVEQSPFLRPQSTGNTFQLTDTIEDSAIKSQYAVLLDAQTGEILAERHSDTLINPASMTKVLSLLTAVEALTGTDGSWDLDSTTANTKAIAEYCWVNDCSMAWFSIGEGVPIRDTLYGTILPSGADAALMLANYAAGSQEALVERMNEKARALGLSDGAHFENCVGLYGENHVCTVRDMAIIMKAAMDHPVCRTVLGKESWQTTHTEQHPAGIALVNRFLRRVKSQDTVLTVIGAKTGYVRQAGNCAVSMARRVDGREYICVTAKGPGSSQVLRDHAALYRMFCAGA